MFGDIKKKISITSLMFNAGFYSSYSMDNEYNNLRPEDLYINSVDEISNEISGDNNVFENVQIIGGKGCSVKKKLLITGIASLGLIALGTGLYFLLRDKNNNDDIVPPVPVTDNFTDRITEIIIDNITTDIVTANSTYIDNITNVTDVITSIPTIDNTTDIIPTTTPTTINTTIPETIDTFIPKTIHATIPTTTTTELIFTTIPTTTDTFIHETIDTFIPETTTTDIIFTTIPTTIPFDKCVDLSMNCSDQEMMNFIKNKFNKTSIERCYGILNKEGLNIIFNNDSNCQVSFYENPSINILNGYNFNSLNVSGVMFENHQGLFDGISANITYFTNVDFKKVLNFSNFLINSNITNVYGLNNILIDKENDIVNFINNCQFTNLEIKNMIVNNKDSISSIIKNSTINNTLDMSNYKTNNTHYDAILKETTVNYINMKNINVRNSNLYIISGFNNIELNNCSMYNSNISRLFKLNTGTSVNMPYCNFENVDFSSFFESFKGYSVDISNTYFHYFYPDKSCQIFHSSNISYLNVSNSIFANIKDATGMFAKGWFKTINLTNTKADNLLSFEGGFYKSTFDNVIMHNFSTKSLTSCLGMFYETRSNGNIRSIDISGWDMGNITNMKKMFYFTNDNNVSNIQYIDASSININNQSQIKSNDFVAPTNSTDLKNIWFDVNNFTKLRDSVNSSGFNCTGDSCYNPRFTLVNNKINTITESDNIMAIKNKNNENLRNDVFNKFNNEDTLNNLKNKFNISVENVDVNLNTETGKESLLLKLKLAINDYLINPFMKFFRLR